MNSIYETAGAIEFHGTNITSTVVYYILKIFEQTMSISDA